MVLVEGRCRDGGVDPAPSTLLIEGFIEEGGFALQRAAWSVRGPF